MGKAHLIQSRPQRNKERHENDKDLTEFPQVLAQVSAHA